LPHLCTGSIPRYKIRTSCYRAVRESGAPAVDISIRVDDEHLDLEICDNGLGIPKSGWLTSPVAIPRRGWGLAGMRERGCEFAGIIGDQIGRGTGGQIGANGFGRVSDHLILWPEDGEVETGSAL
jgi:signal transduction histidine kinase